ncbi:FAD-binding protein [Mycobacterium ulcerans]|uniref:FAD-binding protein n=1 Tax=Mycobacterium ulcerans TaxID=1809 RepID=UPI0033135473
MEFAAGEKRSYLTDLGIRFMPTVGWAERGDLRAEGHGNSVPRFHIAWGTGTGVVEPFVDSALQSAKDKLVTFYHRHRVDELVITDGVATGIKGTVLAPDDAERATPSNRDEVGEFELSAQAVIITTGGIGGNHDMVRRYWPDRMGTPPASMITGVPAYVDGRMLDIANDSEVRLVNRDRMWHYTEGVNNWDPIWPKHAIRIIPGPSSMWFDALGRRLPAPLPARLRHLRHPAPPAHHRRDRQVRPLLVHLEPEDHQERVRPLGFRAEPRHHRQEPQSRSARTVFKQGRDRSGRGVQAPRRRLRGRQQPGRTRREDERPDRRTAAGSGRDPQADEARDLQVANPFCKDVQVQGIRNARRALGDRLGRVAAPHRILDPKAGPLIATKLHILTRKTLGGIQTDLSSRAIGSNGEPIAGLYAAGEVAGFGGGGVHGYNALEGTFLGGCIFSGRAAGRAAADAV